MVGKIATWSLRIGLLLGIPILMCEVALRLVPSLVPPKVLTFFEPELRSELATGRFTTRKEMQLVPRDDGGPDLWIYAPGIVKHYDFPDPGVVRDLKMDEVGFCNPPGSYSDRDRFDLIAIGDSFTTCHAVAMENAWPHELGRRLEAETYNLGKGGIGVDEYVQLLKRYGLPRSPRVVVMNIYEGNDLRDAIRCRTYQARGDPRDAEDSDGGWHDTLLGRTSRAFNFAAAGIDLARAAAQRARDKREVNFRYRVVEGDVEVPFNLQHTDRDEVSIARRLQDGEISFDPFDEALATYAQLARENGFVPVLSYSPSAHTAYAGFTRFEDEENAALLENFSQAMRTYFAAKAKELNLIFLDLTPVLRRHASPIDPENLLYYPTTLHYTARANAIVADALNAVLEDALENARRS